MLRRNELSYKSPVRLNFISILIILISRLMLWFQMFPERKDFYLLILVVQYRDIKNFVSDTEREISTLMYRFTIKNALKHLRVVMRHRRWVRHFCFKARIFKQGLLHDLSKYSPSEFIESATYFVGTSSPIDACKKDKGYSAAWMHHKAHNKHHREYWTDNYDAGTTCIKMPWKYAVECFCDFLGAGIAYNPNSFTPELEFNWWKSNRLNMKINLDTRMLLDILFIAYVNYGERILSNRELLLPLRAAYETTEHTQNNMSITILALNYCLGIEFMRNFSYDYPTWRVNPAIQSQVGGLFDGE